MNQVIGILIILIGFAIAYWMDFSLVSDLIALGALFLGGKIAGFRLTIWKQKKCNGKFDVLIVVNSYIMKVLKYL